MSATLTALKRPRIEFVAKGQHTHVVANGATVAYVRLNEEITVATLVTSMEEQRNKKLKGLDFNVDGENHAAKEAGTTMIGLTTKKVEFAQPTHEHG